MVSQIDRLRRSQPTSIKSFLDDLPGNLEKSYEQTLLKIVEKNRNYARCLFQCLSVSARPLHVPELAKIFSIQFDATSGPSYNKDRRPFDAEEAVLSACSSLITIIGGEGDQVLQFSHYSVKEYLTSDRLAAADGRLSYYHVDTKSAHTLLAHAGLTVLLQLDEKIDRNGIGRFPLAPYAARHWVDHAKFGNLSSHVKNVMEQLFDQTKPHFAAWVWLYDIDNPWEKPMPSIHPTQPEALPLYYAALCGFAGLVGRLLVSHLPDTDSSDGSHTSGRSGLRGRGTLLRGRGAPLSSGGPVRRDPVPHSPGVNNRGGSYTTMLHAAAVKGHVEVTSLLLKSGADPNSRDDLGRAPLHVVSLGGKLVKEKSSVEIARFLVSSGAKVNITDEEGCTPLHTAAMNGYRELAQQLLDFGASIYARNRDQWTPDPNGFTPLHWASRYGHAGVAQLLLVRGSNVHARTTTHITPLHFASAFGHLVVARYLIDRGADVNGFAFNRLTPMHAASSRGHLVIIKLLVERGANVNSRNEKGETPLDLASGSGKLDVVRFLIESGANIHAMDNEGFTPLHMASKNGHLDVVRMLIGAGIPVDIRNGLQMTPLALAAREGKVEVVRFLIEQGANANARYNNGSTPLGLASDNGHLDMVRLLLDRGADPNVQDYDLQSPLHTASYNGHLAVVELLLRRGADVNVRSKTNRTAADLANGSGKFEVARLISEYMADANTRNRTRSTTLDTTQYSADEGGNEGREDSLHAAAEEGNVDVVKSLLDRGAHINHRNADDETPLSRAARKGNVDAVRLLIERGAEVDSRDKWDQTPLQYASRYGHAEVSQVLVEYGANMSSATSHTPDPHAVSEAEAQSYYAGLHSEPTLLYRTGKEQWSPPRGPEAQRRLKELCEVFTHPIANVWNHELGWKVVEVMDAHMVS